MAKKQTYQSQIEELESIIEEMETGDISVDELSSKVKRAALLIRNCRSVLSSTEQEVDAILKDISADSES